MPPTDTVGIRNKNYLNVKNTADRWMDAGNVASGTDSAGHAVFTDAAYGVRAGILQLRAYFFRHNRRTIAEILSRWAPASDTIGSLPGAPPNSPAEYSSFVAGRMGIDYNKRLDAFNEDKSVGNLARLRDLFYAMAEYENYPGFQVPVEEFNAGLELVQPGVTTGGTVATDTPDADPGVAAGALELMIGGSVGRRDKSPVNAEADIKTVQEMLRLASMILREPRIDASPVDGKIGQDPRASATVKAIEAFQSRFMAQPDGVIDVGGRTWRELLAVIEVGEGGDLPIPDTGGRPEFVFPLARVPDWNWTDAPRSFGASRGARAHAACDLYAPKGTTVYAIADGTVTRGAEYFYSKTYAMEIDHGKYLARYGEIQQEAFVRRGDRVRAGQPIAKVGHLVGVVVPSDMLHFELYDKTASGPLTVEAAKSKRTPGGRVFLRRKDLIDPTQLLNEWKNFLPGSLNTLTTPQTDVRPAGGIPADGFCVHVKRIRQETRASAGHPRTLSEYTCYWNGSPLDGLKGQLVERGGPGDNTTEVGDNRDLRIREGVYRLAIHSGSHYRTSGYKDRDVAYLNRPNPGLLLQDTDERTWILIHPGEDYVKSIGCLNPTSGLADADSAIAFADSHARVVAIIEALKSKLGTRFPRSGTIPEALVFIEGEPG